MLFEDTYLSIESFTEATFRDRGSKFIAFAYPINGQAEIKDIIARLKVDHPKANHYCWAMRLSPDRSIFRVNDDGEPSGTAGRPILNVLLSKNVTNVVIVVVRYFGGTLLGVPGLINAYKTSAEMVLATAKIVELTVKDVYNISFNYLQMNEVMKIVKDESVTILEQQLDNNCHLKVAVRKTQINQLLNKLEKIEGLNAVFLNIA